MCSQPSINKATITGKNSLFLKKHINWKMNFIVINIYRIISLYLFYLRDFEFLSHIVTQIGDF